jgi:hypothetical protein
MADWKGRSQLMTANCEIISGTVHTNCSNCLLLKEELLSISLEVKSAYHIISILQEDIKEG